MPGAHMAQGIMVNDKIKLTVSAQNCNSLNLTGLSTIFFMKVAAIKKINTDIIFLSNIRLTNQHGVKNDHKVFNAFKDAKGKSYYFTGNSTKNSRGTGILIANSLDFEIISKVSDPDENFLLIEVHINKMLCILGAVYGPNNISN